MSNPEQTFEELIKEHVVFNYPYEATALETEAVEAILQKHRQELIKELEVMQKFGLDEYALWEHIDTRISELRGEKE